MCSYPLTVWIKEKSLVHWSAKLYLLFVFCVGAGAMTFNSLPCLIHSSLSLVVIINLYVCQCGNEFQCLRGSQRSVWKAVWLYLLHKDLLVRANWSRYEGVQAVREYGEEAPRPELSLRSDITLVLRISRFTGGLMDRGRTGDGSLTTICANVKIGANICRNYNYIITLSAEWVMGSSNTNEITWTYTVKQLYIIITWVQMNMSLTSFHVFWMRASRPFAGKGGCGGDDLFVRIRRPKQHVSVSKVSPLCY